MDGVKNKSNDKDEHFRVLMKKLAEVQHYISYEYEIVSKFEKGENFVGEIRQFRVKGVKQNNDEEILNLIVKTSPSDSNIIQEFPIEPLFKREYNAYKAMLKTCSDLQADWSVPETDKFKYARCFTALFEEKNQSLIFEDLNAKGYKLYDRLQSLDYDHLMLIVKTLAKYHAMSFAIKDKNPEAFNYFKKNCCCTIHDMGTNFNTYFNEMKDTVSKYLDNDIKQKFIGFFNEEMLDKYCKYLNIHKGACDDPYFIIAHGDTWINNMLFKYENSKVSEVILIDWAIAKYCAPITDLVYLLFCCTGEQIRLQTYDRVFQTYYSTLRNMLVKLGCDPDKLYPESVYKQQQKDYLGFGLLMAIGMVPLVLNNRENPVNVGDLAEDGFKVSALKHSRKCVIRIKGVVRHFVDLGVI